jgi:hypothetical protein
MLFLVLITCFGHSREILSFGPALFVVSPFIRTSLTILPEALVPISGLDLILPLKLNPELIWRFTPTEHLFNGVSGA